MVVDKLFEFIEDIERFCINHRWSRFFNDWETDEAYNLWEMIDFVGSLKENTMENKNQFFESLLQVEK